MFVDKYRPKAPAKSVSAPPALLISLHDVSPLTLASCEEAVGMLHELGVSAEALTILAIPYHNEQMAIDRHPPTIRFLRELQQRGSCIVMHGLTHRMDGRAWSPIGIACAHIFARGEGELYNRDAAETARRLDQGQEILCRAGLLSAAQAFVPPAWLLSAAARRVVADRGFEFFELFGGIVRHGRIQAPRVVGWGSLTAVDAWVTAAFAHWQTRRTDRDTRLAIHPADMRRASQRRAICNAITRLLPRMRLWNYTDYLADPGRSLAPDPDGEPLWPKSQAAELPGISKPQKNQSKPSDR